MFFKTDADKINAIYNHAIERREKHKRTAEMYESQQTFLQVPLLISTSVSTTISALHFTGFWFGGALLLTSLASAVFHGLPFVLNLKNNINSHQKSVDSYSKIINFLSFEYALNMDRKADFYPYLPHMPIEGDKIKVPISTEEEYKTYFYSKLYELLDNADNEAEVFSRGIEQLVIPSDKLIV